MEAFRGEVNEELFALVDGAALLDDGLVHAAHLLGGQPADVRQADEEAEEAALEGLPAD